MSELKDRVKAKTPKWFKAVIKLGLQLAAAGVTIKVTAATLDGFAMNAMGNTICNYMIIAGAVAAAVAKTAKENCDEEL